MDFALVMCGNVQPMQLNIVEQNPEERQFAAHAYTAVLHRDTDRFEFGLRAAILKTVAVDLAAEVRGMPAEWKEEFMEFFTHQVSPH